MIAVTIPAKTLQRIRQMAKDNHSQNVSLSIGKGKVYFKICETGTIVEVEGIKE